MKQSIKFATQVAGVFFCLTVATVAQNGLVVIDEVSNTTSAGQLIAGNTHQISIRYDLRDLSGQKYWIGSNGFELYSPDGADWGYLQGTPGPLVATAASRGSLIVYQKHHFFDGVSWSLTGNGGLDPAPGSSGSNTRAGFYLATLSAMGDAGYAGGLDNDIALTLEISSSMADCGLSLCADTCYGITAWEWAAGAFAIFPQWDNGLGVDGPRCFEIVDCSVGDDTDSDGWVDGCDNCPSVYNPGQEERGDDGIGDACSNEVWLEPGDGFVNKSRLVGGRVHRVTMNFASHGFECDHNWSSSNAWELYSPDGANWNYLSGSVTSEFAYAQVDGGGIFEKHYYKEGGTGLWQETGNGGDDPAPGNLTGTDTVGWYLGNNALWPGTPPGYEGSAAILEFSVNLEDLGLHICIDTSDAFSSWQWACAAESAFPIWDYSAPVCFEIYDKCCFGRVGDANCSGNDEPTIGDIAYMIDRKFIMMEDPVWCCLDEADINFSGIGNPTPDDITIGDISILIDYLFITGPSLGLPDCL